MSKIQKKAAKFWRELARIFNPVHLFLQMKFLGTILWARMVKTPAFMNVSDSFPIFGADDHLIGFVIYSPDGIRADTKAALRELAAVDKVKIIVLMNHSPTDADEIFLRETGLSYVRRENTGYDFGAYRDCVLSLGDRSLRRLTLMNDSFIFPLSGTIAQMVAALEQGPFTGLSEQAERKAKTRHVCSYCLSFDKCVISHKAFHDFWRGYSPQIDRRYTIKAGEIGLSQHLINKGIEPLVLYEKQGLLLALSKASEQTLNSMITTLTFSEVITPSERDSLQTLPPDAQRDGLGEFIKRTENLRLSPAYTLAMDMPFIKRRNLEIYPDLARWYADHFDLVASAQKEV